MVTEMQTPPATLLQRMIAVGISEDRARAHITRDAVRVKDETVSDPDAVVPWSTAIVVAAPLAGRVSEVKR